MSIVFGLLKGILVLALCFAVAYCFTRGAVLAVNAIWGLL